MLKMLVVWLRVRTKLTSWARDVGDSVAVWKIGFATDAYDAGLLVVVWKKNHLMLMHLTVGWWFGGRIWS